MIDYRRKVQTAIILLLLTGISCIQADYACLPRFESELSLPPPCPPQCFSPCYACEPTCCYCCCGCGYISADLLIWRPFQDGLNTCVPTFTSDTVTDGVVTSLFSGTGRDPNFKWRTGFRIGAGYELPSSNWDVGASWSHFNSHTNGEDTNNLLWRIHFDVVDVAAGYDIDLSRCVTLRPFAGLRTAIIDQRLQVRESGTSLITADSKENFFGVGPLFGLEGLWNVGGGFSWYASASASVLYGTFGITLNETTQSPTANSFANVSKHLNASQTAADLALGIRWQRCFCKTNLLLLQVGIEHHRYFNYNRICHYGDLSFDGLNFSAAVVF